MLMWRQHSAGDQHRNFFPPASEYTSGDECSVSLEILKVVTSRGAHWPHLYKENMMKKFCFLSILVPLIGAATAVQADTDQNALVLTSSNAAQNQLLVYNTGGQLIQTVPTQGQGGVSGNAGGIGANGNMVAVVNFGSQSVSIFERRDDRFRMKQLVPTVSSPVSLAFGAGP